MSLTWGEVDGVRAVWPSGEQLPGPLQGCLMFGVGRANETLPSCGISHVVEHVTLHPLGRRAYMYNGQVSPVSTRFHALGSAEQLVEFFRDVTQNLQELPQAGFENELRILKVEAQKQSGGQLGFDLSVRFGPRGPGLVGWAEHGLSRLSYADARAWAGEWFTAANAVLWLSGPPPEDLDLSALPRGHDRQPPGRPPTLTDPYTWVAVDTAMASISVLSEQLYAVIPVLQVAQERALERLRREQGITYQVNFAHVRLPGGWALEFLAADGAKDSHGQVVSGLLDVLEELAATGPTASELALRRSMWTGLRDAPQAVLGTLDGDAEREVLGLERRDREDADALFDALTPEQARSELSQVLGSLLVIGTKDIREPDRRLTAIADWSKEQAIGVEYAPVGDREKGVLVMAEDAMSWVLDDAHFRTIRWTEVVGVRCWDSGLREVIGPTGMSIFVAPWNWIYGESLPALIDARVGPDRLLPMEQNGTATRPHPSEPDRLLQRRWLATVVGASCRGKPTDVVLRTDGLYLLANQRGANVQERLRVLSSADHDELMRIEGGSTCWPIEAIATVSLEKPKLLTFSKTRPAALLRVVGTDGSSFAVEELNQDHLKTIKSEFPNVFGLRFSAKV